MRQFAAIDAVFALVLAVPGGAQAWSVIDSQPTGTTVFDERHQRAVRFDPPRRWEWRQDRWHLDPVAMPVPPAGSLTHYDGHRGVFLGVTPALQVVEWNGLQWASPVAGSLPPVRQNFALAFDRGRRRLVLFGGESAPMQPRNDTWEWDGATWLQRQPALAPPPRARAVLTHDPQRQRTVLFGGDAYFDTWTWDGTVWQQVLTPTSPPAGTSASTFDPGLGKVVVMAGGAVAWAFDGADWASLGTPLATVVGAKLVPAGNGDLLVVGDATTWWRHAGVWAERVHAAPGLVVRDAARAALFTYDGSTASVWNGAWSRPIGTQPPVRYYTAMAFDAARAEVVMFGGSVLQLPAFSHGDTWRWNGTQWQAVTTAVAPSPRMWHAMAYDGAQQVVVLFGGRAGSPVFLADTWTWDGTGWHQQVPVSAPSARAQHQLAYDERRRCIVMTGGLGTGNGLADTWEWDGSQWSARPSGTYPGVTATNLASPIVFDGLHQQVVSFPASGVIAWNGVSWQPHALSAPGPRRNLVYDPVIARVLANESAALLAIGPTPATAGNYGSGCGGIPPILQASGRVAPGNATFELTVATHRASTPTFLLLGLQPAAVSIGGGCTALVQTPSVLVGAAGGGGFADFVLPIPGALDLRGFSVHVQSATLVAGGAAPGLDLSQGLRVVVGD